MSAPAVSQPSQVSHSELINFYLDRQKEAERPTKGMITGIALVISVVAALFSGFAGFSAFIFGLGVCLTCMGISHLILNRNLTYHINRDAAEALISPGFFEFARRNPRNFASPEAILGAHQEWIRS